MKVYVKNVSDSHCPLGVSNSFHEERIMYDKCAMQDKLCINVYNLWYCGAIHVVYVNKQVIEKPVKLLKLLTIK